MHVHNCFSTAGPTTRGNVFCGGPTHRGGHVVIRALGGNVSGRPVHTRALAR
jgi:hypothetical protein